MIYRVHVNREVAENGEGTRRRGGFLFSSSPLTLPPDVEQKALRAILDDPYLIVAKEGLPKAATRSADDPAEPTVEESASSEAGGAGDLESLSDEELADLYLETFGRKPGVRTAETQREQIREKLEG